LNKIELKKHITNDAYIFINQLKTRSFNVVDVI